MNLPTKEVRATQIYALAREHDVSGDEDDGEDAFYLFDRDGLRAFALDLFRLVSDRVEVQPVDPGAQRIKQGG